MADLFNEKANDWDTKEVVLTLSTAVGATILKNIPLNERMQVMDFGAGTGLISSQVAPLVEKIVAVDTSESMLNQLASKAELQQKVEIACQNILTNNLAKKFDLIMSAMALHHVDDTNKLMLKFAEHLHPGGLIALADLDLEDGSFHAEGTEGIFHFGFDRHKLQCTLEDSGFVEINFVTAHTIQKEEKEYPVFLVVAKKKFS